MTKYVISGYIGFDNFGDEAIAGVLSQKLKTEGAEKITFISSNPSKTAELYGTDSCGRFNFPLSLLKSDVLISGGGSLLQDVTSLKSLLYYLGVIYFALFLGKKVVIYAQGIGPIKSKLGIFLTKNALKRASEITVRDKKSKELLNSWGISAEIVEDPVFSIELPIKNIKGTVGIQLRNFAGLNGKFLNSLADEISERFKDKTFNIISFQDSVDLDICREFAELLKTKTDSQVNLLYGLDVKEIFEKVSELEYMIAMRFHANVAAIKSGVKTLAISYDIKVKKLAEEYSIPCIELNSAEFKAEFDKLIS